MGTFEPLPNLSHYYLHHYSLPHDTRNPGSKDIENSNAKIKSDEFMN